MGSRGPRKVVWCRSTSHAYVRQSPCSILSAKRLSITGAGTFYLTMSPTDRLLRYQSALGLIKEVSEGTYSASHITPHLASPEFVAGLKHKYGHQTFPQCIPSTSNIQCPSSTFVFPSFAALSSFLAETNYRNPSDAFATAFQKASTLTWT